MMPTLDHAELHSEAASRVQPGRLRSAAFPGLLPPRSAASPAFPPALRREGFRPRQHLRLRLYGALAGIDIACMAAGFLGADLLHHGTFASRGAVDALALILPLFLWTAATLKAYGLPALADPRAGLVSVTKALAVAAALTVTIIFYLRAGTDFSRFVFAAGTLLSAGLLCGGRAAFGQWIGRRHNWTFTDEVLLVDGVPMRPQPGQRLIRAEEAALSAAANDPDTFSRIGTLLADCDRVLLACLPHRRVAWARALKGVGVDVEVLMPELDHFGALRLRRSGGRCVALVAAGPLSLADRILKRGLDLVVAVAGIVVLAPILLVIAALIRLESPGPALFGQLRTGLANRTFRVLKFRTMRHETQDSAGHRSAARDDVRITRVGAFLRRTSLDELPQLFNVLAGDMSIVGPRPHALASTAEDLLFWNIEPSYWQRGAVKPGITGLAQVRGFRGATLTREDLTNRLRSDLEYVSGWSLWRDLAIIARTAAVLVHRNAY